MTLDGFYEFIYKNYEIIEIFKKIENQGLNIINSTYINTNTFFYAILNTFRDQTYYVDSQRNMAVEMDDKDLKGSIKKGGKKLNGEVGIVYFDVGYHNIVFIRVISIQV